MADAQPLEGLSVVIDDDDDTVRVDPVTGSMETKQPGGGIVVSLDDHRPKTGDEDDDFYANLAGKIAPLTLAATANELCDQIAADDSSRANYLAITVRGLDLLGIELKEPRANAGDSSAAVEGMSSVTNPLLLEAILKGWANAQAELLPSEGPVKAEMIDNASPAEEALAETLERDMNYYLTTTASEYYPDTSHMLLWGVYFKGSGFKKVYRCPMRRRPVSESVPCEDLIVSDTTKDLRSCARITHKILMRPSVMKRMRHLGAYLDKAPLIEPTPQVSEVDAKIGAIQGTDPSKQRPEEQPYTLYETQCELDLPDFAPSQFKDKAIPLPYLVTIDKDSRQILSLRRDWNEDDEHCERKRMYVKYPYVPGPGFYGTGMLNILGNASAAMTAAWREALDAGMFANFPSFLIAKLAGRQNTSDFRLAPGTGASIDTGNQPIQSVVANLPYRDVTPGLLSLIDKITSQAQAVGGTADIPTAEGVQNVPVGTMLAQIEQATKVMAAAHKGMHQAQAEEIGLLVELFRANPQDFWSLNKICNGCWNEQNFLQALDDHNIVPRSDPNTPSHIHRVAKALALVQLTQNPVLAPYLSPKEILSRVFNVIREDPAGLIQDPPQQVAPPAPPQKPPPDPLIGQARMISAQAQIKKAQTDAQNDAVQNQIDQQKLEVDKAVATTDLAKEMIIHKDDSAREERDAQRQHGLAVGEQNLAGVQTGHDRSLDLAKHALDVHQALNPPQPTDSGSKESGS